ncbi:MAG: hypothetical protein IPL59_18190 [Candidatus Competibacteraceae bacterium]|nr:hypothetical protein [Candidatus Competibacteraceae bacterium]
MSSLRKFQIEPNYILNNALSMFRSKKIRTAIVEGVCDKRFLSQWIPLNAAIRFDGLDGKSLVNLVYKNSRLKPYSDYEFLYFFADVDFDVITNQPLHKHPKFIYNVFCFEENRLHYNDLETYLINTSAFEKVLVNLDIDVNEAASLRERLERASRVTGSLRAADIIVQRSNNLRSSILNGLEIRPFFSSRDIAIDQGKLFKALPTWSNYREYTDDLVEAAKRLDRELPLGWSLSRGHDLTEMLALHLECRGQRGITAEKLELMLRLACELAEFQGSPMGKRLTASGGMTAMSPACEG